MTFVSTLKDLGAGSKLELESCMSNCDDWHARRDAQPRPS